MIKSNPKAEVLIDKQLIKKLIVDQCPQFAKHEIDYLDSGWDNENFRLGVDCLIRLPRRRKAVELIENEAYWLEVLRTSLPIAIPQLLFLGKESKIFKWPWVIYNWIEGTTANRESLKNSEADKLVGFLKVLHNMPCDDAPYNAARSESLKTKTEGVYELSLIHI